MDASLLDRHRRLLLRSAALDSVLVGDPEGAEKAKQKVVDICERYPYCAVYVAWDSWGPTMHFHYFPRDPQERKQKIFTLPDQLALTLSQPRHNATFEEVKVHIFVLQ